MVGVVLCYVAASLVQHGEEGAKAAQAREIHDVLQLESMFERLCHQPVRREVGLHDGGRISLDLLIKYLACFYSL